MRSSQENNTISLLNVSKEFKGKKALENISFTVKKGELFGVLGPDGAGKTTLMRLLAGIMLPTSGTITIKGIDINNTKENIKLLTGYMPREYGLYNDLTAEENIEFYADLFKIPKKRRTEKIDTQLAQTSMSEFRKRASGKLSGGMKQKLQLICSLMHEPEFLFLDEPTFGVDPVSRREFWKILLKLLENGLTVIIATSYMDEAERCRQIALLNNGKIITLETPQKIKSSIPGKMLEITGENIVAIEKKLKSNPLVTRTTRYGNVLHVLHNGTLSMREEEYGHFTSEPINPSLEDAFIYLTEDRNETGQHN